MLLRAAVLALLAGCSFVFVKAPPPPCTTSAVVPIVDTAVTVLAAIGAIYVASTDADTKEIGVAVETGIAAGFATSAYVGFRRIGRCHATPPIPEPPR